jgi:hypothetical protein
MPSGSPDGAVREHGGRGRPEGRRRHGGRGRRQGGRGRRQGGRLGARRRPEPRRKRRRAPGAPKAQGAKGTAAAGGQSPEKNGAPPAEKVQPQELESNLAGFPEIFQGGRNPRLWPARRPSATPPRRLCGASAGAAEAGGRKGNGTGPQDLPRPSRTPWPEPPRNPSSLANSGLLC